MCVGGGQKAKKLFSEIWNIRKTNFYIHKIYFILIKKKAPSKKNSVFLLGCLACSSLDIWIGLKIGKIRLRPLKHSDPRSQRRVHPAIRPFDALNRASKGKIVTSDGNADIWNVWCWHKINKTVMSWVIWVLNGSFAKYLLQISYQRTYKVKTEQVLILKGSKAGFWIVCSERIFRSGIFPWVKSIVLSKWHQKHYQWHLDI